MRKRPEDKQRHTKAKAPEPDAAGGDTVEKVVLLMISGLPTATIAAACIEKLGVKVADVDGVMKAARERIVRAAEFRPEDELGLAVTRLDDLYKRAVRVEDTKTALAVVRERSKLLDIYNADLQAPAVAEARAIIAQVANAADYVCDFERGGRPAGWSQAACPCPHCAAVRWLAKWATAESGGRNRDRGGKRR